MRQIFPVMLACLGIGLAGTACEGLQVTETPVEAATSAPICSAPGADIQLGMTDYGKTIDMSPGQSLAISLGSNASTGYEWLVQRISPSQLEFIGKTYENWNLIPGSGGSESLCFTARATGVSKLELYYRRSFEPASIAPVQTFAISVSIE
jgi:inhibitor of cysteine peptidase